MTSQRSIRQGALRVLYMLDTMQGQIDDETIRPLLLEEVGDESGVSAAFELAHESWKHADAADAAISPMCPDWPIKRQPVIDRNILRLVWFEMTTGRTPPKAAINEAIEMARRFSTERSPAFVNGVLDKILKMMTADQVDADTHESSV